MSPILLWILFLLGFWALLPFLARRSSLLLIAFCAVLSYCISSATQVEFPTPVFWIMIVCLTPMLLLSSSVGRVLFWMLLFRHFHVYDFIVHSRPGAILFQIFFVLILALLFSKRISPVCFVCWIAVAATFRSTISPQMSYNWMTAWVWLLSVLTQVLPPGMPIIWYTIWVPAIFYLAFLMHADSSAGRFFVWTLTTFVLRLMFYPLYVLYYYFPEKDKAFPLSLFSGRWKVSSPKWSPLSARSGGPPVGTVLCDRCQATMGNSALIMGSKGYFTSLIEWHDLECSLEDLRNSIKATNTPCHLCNLLWHSISQERRNELFSKNQTNKPVAFGGSIDLLIPGSGSDISPNSLKNLKLKIWEERPLTLYTYVQLMQGENFIGSRLLVHRTDLFQQPSPACREVSTGSYEHMEQAKKWLENCRTHHCLCREIGNSLHEPPTRLIQVMAVDSSHTDALPKIKLKVVDPEEKQLSYLALSHCWGKTKPFSLLQNNYLSSLDGIDFSLLAKNMQDAVRITRDLGYEYIWIDSLCIIQDSAEDWTTEAAKMGTVYSGAVCTIASTGSDSSEGGCFHTRDRLSLRPCKIGVSSADALQCQWIYIRRDDVFNFERHVDRAPLNKRAWVLQERLLSPRILHFGAEILYWECCQRSASELYPLGYTYKRYPDDFSDNYAPDLTGIETRGELELAERNGKGMTWASSEMIRKRPPPISDDPDVHMGSNPIWERRRGFWKNIRKSTDQSWDKDQGEVDNSGFRAAFDKLQKKRFSSEQIGMSSFSYCWYEIVESYSRGHLTYAKDKLVALSGIVQQVEKSTGYTYLAGLWKEHLVTDLLWFATEGPGLRLMEKSPTVLLRGTASADNSNASSIPMAGSNEPMLAGIETSKYMPKTSIPDILPCMAPTWSWASIEGTVAFDLLPDNSLTKMGVKKTLVTILDATVAAVRQTPDGRASEALGGVLSIQGPLCKVQNVQRDGEAFYIGLATPGHPSARLFPDVFDSSLEGEAGSDLFCLSFLVLARESTGFMTSSTEEIVGLIIKLREQRDTLPNTFERIGLFTTSLMKGDSSSRKLLKEAPTQHLHVI